MNLRPYQRRAIDQLYEWLRKNDGHPCLVLPTGSGKSVIIAELCREAIQNYPETRILMLTHVRELLEQNHNKLRTLWPNAPVGLYSAGLNRKELSEPITFAGIQSIHKKALQVGHVDIVIIDEAHLVNHKDEGGYREFLKELEAINPSVRIIGLTASPYRLGHGLITDKPAIFDDLIEPVSIEELHALGFLSNLRSKVTKQHFDLSGVHKRGGEYIESELQEAVDTDVKNRSVIDEVILRAGDRKAWLLFCAGVDHAIHVRDVLREKGITAEVVTGDTPSAERRQILTDYKAGKIRALTSVAVLTTGFDYPDIDLIALLRPTMSPGLYLQMAGRGFRVKSHTDHCLVLDFAGIIEQHGPVTAIRTPKKFEEGKGIPPSKECPECGEIIAAQCRICTSCGYEFPIKDKDDILELRNDDIMGKDLPEMKVAHWDWQLTTSKSSGKEMLVVTYYGGISDTPIREYLCVYHGGVVGDKSKKLLMDIAKKAGVGDLSDTKNLDRGRHPSVVKYQKDGKFFRVVERIWEQETFEDEEMPF